MAEVLEQLKSTLLVSGGPLGIAPADTQPADISCSVDDVFEQRIAAGGALVVGPSVHCPHKTTTPSRFCEEIFY